MSRPKRKTSGKAGPTLGRFVTRTETGFAIRPTAPRPQPAPAAPPERPPVSPDDVRLCAYLKWEAAGRPPGDGVDFWLEAERELGGRPA